jgi:hypothetical protein
MKAMLAACARFRRLGKWSAMERGWLAVVVVVLAACSSSATSGLDAAQSDGASDAGVAIDAETADAGGAIDAGGDDAGASSVRGTVAIAELKLGATWTHIITAGFRIGSSCTLAQIGPCSFSSCPAGATSMRASAGDITISGGLFAPPLVLVPDAMGAYANVQAAGQVFSPGDILHLVAQGATGGVPAFDAAITAPSTATITTPLFQQGQLMTINRATDLAVGWTNAPGANGQVGVNFLGPSGAGLPSTVLSCLYSMTSTGGSAAIPAAALAMVPAGMGSIEILAERQLDFLLGNVDTLLVAASALYTGAGAIATANADFQ